MRIRLLGVLLFASGCYVYLEGSALHPSPVRSSPDLPWVKVELAPAIVEQASCAEMPEILVRAWRPAVERSVQKLLGPERQGPGGRIVLELMDPVCATGKGSVSSQVRYRARLYRADGSEAAATNGLAPGIDVASTYGGEGLQRSLSTALEFATQQALTPLLAQAH